MTELIPSILIHNTEHVFPYSPIRIDYQCSTPVPIWNAVNRNTTAIVHVTLLEVESGGGKTTLMNILNAYLSRTLRSHTVRISPEPNWDYSIAYIPQKPNIVRHWKISDLVPKENANFLQKLLPIDPHSLPGQRIADFSGGQVSRIFVASALHRLESARTTANYLLLDEAFEGIDATLLKEALTGIQSEWTRACPGRHLFILLVTHVDLSFAFDQSSQIDLKRIGLKRLPSNSNDLQIHQPPQDLQERILVLITEKTDALP